MPAGEPTKLAVNVLLTKRTPAAHKAATASRITTAGAMAQMGEQDQL